MASRELDIGASALGAIVLISVFGPMVLVAILWAAAAGVGHSGSVRDTAGELMVWVLMTAGVLLTIEEALLALFTLSRPRAG